MTNRRTMLTVAGGVVASALASRERASAKPRFASLADSFARLEKTHGGRLGISVIDVGSGERTGHRADERFAMCSTFKWLLAAAVLKRVDAGAEKLDRPVAIPAKPLLSHSPLTEPHAGSAMPVSALCHAAVTVSDNTAANLLLDAIGGPAGLTKFARSIGDSVTRLDRMELELNEATPGDPRDTTSPAAMTGDLKTLLLGTTLSVPSRTQLTQWLVDCATGLNKLRAAAPKDWRAGDKTGSNGATTSNDVAIFWPPSRSPILVSAYLTECPGAETKRIAIIAEVGRLIVEAAGS